MARTLKCFQWVSSGLRIAVRQGVVSEQLHSTKYDRRGEQHEHRCEISEAGDPRQAQIPDQYHRGEAENAESARSEGEGERRAQSNRKASDQETNDREKAEGSEEVGRRSVRAGESRCRGTDHRSREVSKGDQI